jgi:hypothetical protein
MSHEMTSWISAAVILACFAFALYISRGPRPKP